MGGSRPKSTGLSGQYAMLCNATDPALFVLGGSWKLAEGPWRVYAGVPHAATTSDSWQQT
jgi:hypothetical protein